MRARLGEILVEGKLVAQSQVDAALAVQAHTGRRLGEELVARGLLSESALAQVLSKKLGVPWVALRLVRIERCALDLFSADACLERRCLPLYVGLDGEGKRVVYVATDDPTVPGLADELAAIANIPVLFMVAPARELHRALDAAYAWHGSAEVADTHFRWADHRETGSAESLSASATSSEHVTSGAERNLAGAEGANRRAGSEAAAGVRCMTMLDGTRVPMGAPSKDSTTLTGHRVLLEQRARRLIERTAASSAQSRTEDGRVTRGLVRVGLSVFGSGLMSAEDFDALLADFEAG